MRHRRASQGWQGSLHQRQQGPSGEPWRALRQGQRRYHAALQPCAAKEAAAAHRPTRLRRVSRDRMGRSAGNRNGAPFTDPADRSEKARLLHRARPVAIADRLVGGEIRHPELRRAWRLLLGEHGRRRHLYDRRFLLGVRRTRLGSHPLLHAVRRGRGSRFEPHQDRARQAQGAWREVCLGQSLPDRLQRHRRRLDRHPAGDGRAVRAGDRARTPEIRQSRPRLSPRLHQRACAGDPGAGSCRRRALPARCGRQAARLGPGSGRGGERARSLHEACTDRSTSSQRPALRPGLPTARRTVPRRQLFARCGRRALRHRRSDHPADRRRARSCRLRTGDRVAGGMDRLGGPPPRDDARPADRHARHARHLGPHQWLPHLPRHPSAAGAARHRRRARRFPLQAAFPETRAAGSKTRRQGWRQADDAAVGHAAWLRAWPGGPVGRRGRQGAAHRQGLFVGSAARRPRAHAYGHPQCLGRRPLQDRHTVPLYGQHGLELVDEHGRDDPDAHRQG